MRDCRILLIDLDSTIPNLALMKISAYWKANGATVSFNQSDPTHIYISCIFKMNRHLADSCARLHSCIYPNAIIDIGGPGYSLSKVLPNEIESMNPDYSIYPKIDYAMGFTTRGCIRHCPFCIVPIKEGKLKRNTPIEQIYEPRFKQIKLLDNNILADMENFRNVVKFCSDHKLKVDFSQGLDARLLTEESAILLSTVKPMHNWVFAFDSLNYKAHVLKAVDLLKDAGINIRSRVMFYVYCDKSEGEYGIKSALERCRILKDLGTNPYVMLDIDTEPTKDMKNLKRWANRKHIFWSTDFENYCHT